MSINRFWTPQTLWAKSQTIISKFLLIVTSNPFLQLLIKYLRSFDVFGGLYVDIQWISGTILGQCQPLGMLKYLKYLEFLDPLLDFWTGNKFDKMTILLLT